MKFLVDAHLPRRLCSMLAEHGHDATHTLDLPDGNATKDGAINQYSIDQQRVVISKDADFFYSHLLHGRPWKLLLVKTGNISMRDLRTLLERNLPAIEAAFQTHSLVEVDRQTLTLVA
jgi:predicted nuclease of predicted toxin-antitoxin system